MTGEDEKPMVVRPKNGSRRLRKHASIRLEDGAIVATDRRGQSRTFPIDGSDDSPSGFQYTTNMDDGGYYLEDRRGRSLVRLGGLGWDIDDPPYFAWASGSAAVGMAAVSLYWLHIAPEAVMMLVALPALILFVWFITLTKLSMPSSKEIAAMQQHAHEMSVKADAQAEEILKRYGMETTPEPETDKP